MVCLAYISVAWLLAPADAAGLDRATRATLPLIEQEPTMIQSLFDSQRPACRACARPEPRAGANSA